MSIAIVCPGCGKQFRAHDEDDGRRTKCTGCGLKLVIDATADGGAIPATDQPAPVATVRPRTPVSLIETLKANWQWAAAAVFALIAIAAIVVVALRS